MGTGLYVAGGILLALFLFVVGIYNGFVKLRNQISEAFSTMDVYLKRRYDAIPNLVEIVKGYAAHERDTLEQVAPYAFQCNFVRERALRLGYYLEDLDDR